MSVECPFCKGKRIITIYRPEIYEFPYFCRDCDKGFTEKDLGGGSSPTSPSRLIKSPDQMLTWIKWFISLLMQPKHYDRDMPSSEYWLTRMGREGWRDD